MRAAALLPAFGFMLPSRISSAYGAQAARLRAQLETF